ncbi:MAG TPA: L,D-transpeptidase [Candidatus Paceibacterota bacterium]
MCPKRFSVLKQCSFVVLVAGISAGLLGLMAAFTWHPEVEVYELETVETPVILEQVAPAVSIVEMPPVPEPVEPVEDVLFDYVEVIGGCGQDFEGQCVVARSGPGGEYPVVFHLRNHAVLKVGGQVEHDGKIWYKIVFDEWLRYPERVAPEWYVSADVVRVLQDKGEQLMFNRGVIATTAATSSKRIVVDLSDQKLYAYEGETLIKESVVSTGRMLSSTPVGTFTIYKKTPSRFMQGPLPGLLDQTVYDLPGVPWNLYFTEDGSVIHGTYWHDNFGRKYSHGCVNLTPQEAEELYHWAELGMTVEVRD